MNLNYSIFKSVMALALVAGLASFAQADTFTFDVAAANWSGSIDYPSTSGDYTFTNPTSGFVNNTATGGAGNQLLIFHGGNAEDPALLPPDHQVNIDFNVQDAADVNQTFTLDDLEFFNDDTNTASDAVLTGLSGGVPQWTISGTHAGLVSAATTGSFANPIDTINWDTLNYEHNVFASKIDNVNFTVAAVPEPGSLALLGMTGLLGLSRRRR